VKIMVRAESPSLRSRRPYALRKLRAAFARVSKDVHGIDLLLLDANGPRGGVDKVSRIAVDLGRGRRPLRLEGVGRTSRESVNDAVARAKRLVVRSIARQRTRARKGRKRM
jgi:putative sigma-54 modulation protein